MRITIPRRFSAALLDTHGWLGLLFAWALYLVCFSGSLAVVTDEFAQWERPDAPVVSTATPADLARVSREAWARAQAAGGAENLFIAAPTPTYPALLADAFGAKADLGWVVTSNGKLIDRPATPWTEFMRGHHHDFNLPDPFGDYLVGIIGTLLLASLISGVLAHRRVIRDAFRLRWGGSKRLTNADLHNRIGIWALPFHFIVSLTGSLLGLSGLIIGVLAMIAYQGNTEKAVAALLGPQPGASTRAAPIPDILPMIRPIEARKPGAEVTTVLYRQVGTAGQIVNISTAEPGHLSRAEYWTFAGDGRFLDKARMTDGTLGMRLYGMITPLHYGTYGGLPLKLIYVLLGFGLTTIAATSVNVWLARRREQGRAAPRRERLWVAMVWGQPTAFAISAVAVLVGVDAPLPVYWTCVVVGLLTALAIREAGSARRWYQIVSAIGIITLAAIHVSMRSHSVAAIGVDSVLGVLGLSLACTAIRLRPRDAPRVQPSPVLAG